MRKPTGRAVSLSVNDLHHAILRVRAWLYVHGNGVKLAKALGLPPPAISAIKHGKRKLGVHEVERTCRAMRLQSLNVLIAPLTDKEYAALPFETGRPRGGTPLRNRADDKDELCGLYDSLNSSGAEAQQEFMRAAHESAAKIKAGGSQPEEKQAS